MELQPGDGVDLGIGAKDVTVEYSTDGSDLDCLGRFRIRPGRRRTPYAPRPIDLGGVAAKYVKLTIKSNWGGLLPQYGLSEVRFYYVPVTAREPEPAAGATDVNPQVHSELASRTRGRLAQGLSERRSAGGGRRHRSRRDGLRARV